MAYFKKCNKCKKEISQGGFHQDETQKDSLSKSCRFCSSKLTPRKNTSKKDAKKTQKAIIGRIYGHQKDRSVKRKHPMPNYAKEQLSEWMYDNGYYALWCQWNWSNHNINFVPSCDRLEDDKPYTLTNMRLVTWRANLNKAVQMYGTNFGKEPIKVIQYLNGVKIKTHESIRKAEKETKIPRRSISNCCNGVIPDAGGYQWKKE